jgi:hypothetical protein
VRFCLTLALTIATSLSIHAEDVRVLRVNVVEFGIYELGKTIAAPHPNMEAGQISPAGEQKLVEVTTTIRAKIGLSFGVRFVLIGSPQGQGVHLTYVTRFPAPGATNPTTGTVHDKSEFLWPTTIGKNTARSYRFDESWELLPGKWSLEFWYEGRKLGEQTFTVVLP